MKFKEEKYGNLVVLMKGFFNKGENTNQLKDKFLEEQYRAWLYSSDEVVLATNTLIDTLIKLNGQNASHDLVGNVVLAMRKDMLKKTKLSASDFKYTFVMNPDDSKIL
jgi:hypothetical protein